MTKTFSDYGKEFQEKFVQALISDARFSEQMLEVFNPEYVEVKHLQFLADRYFQYAKKYRVFPSLKLLITIIRDDLKNESDNILKERIVSYIKLIRTNPDPEDLPWVKEKALDFCKKQALKDALEKSVDLIATDKYESIVELIKTAVLVGTAPSLGHDLIEDVDSRFERFLRNCVPTGLEELDKKGVLNGGTANGELAVILSTSGAGKSHWLVQLGANAIKLGLNVVHYTYELSEPNVGMRYDSYLCETDVDDLIENKVSVQKFYEQNKSKLGKLIIKEFPTNYASVFTLKSHIERLSLSGFIPNLIIVDYADVMRSSRKFESLRHELRQVYEDLRSLAGEMKVPVWTACFEGDTEIESPLGKFKIKDMVGKSGFPVYSYNHTTDKIELRTVKSVYFSNSGVEVMKVTLDNGKFVIATPNHKFLKRDGTYEELQNLKIGDSLMPLRLCKDAKNWDAVTQNDMTDETVSDMLDIWREEKKQQILEEQRKIKKLSRSEINKRASLTKFGCEKEVRIQKHIELAKLCKYRQEFLYRTRDIPLDINIKSRIWKEYNHKIVSIEKLSERANVYNMEVDDLHNYGLGCGIVVKNSQSNREGIDADVLDASNVSEAYGKVMTADIILSISRKTHEKSVGTGRLFVVKNRAGRDGLLFPMTINTARSKFELGEQSTQSVTDVQKSEELEQKKRMKEKWNELTRSGKLKLSSPNQEKSEDTDSSEINKNE